MQIDLGKAKELFLAILEMSAPDRAAYLDTACAGDTALRQRIEAMLRTHENSGELLPRPPAEMIADASATEADATAAFAPQPQGPATFVEAIATDAESLSFLTPSNKPGHLGRLGHYEIQEIIGKGGFGTVLKAFDEKLHRVVAIKVLAPELAANGSARQRFIREARTAAAVSHDHVVTIHVVDEEHRPPYIVMQLIDGVTLQQKLDKVGALSLKEILRIGLQTAEGLAAAHKQGLVHRDIKPANILLENGIERVKITDFGLARAVDDASVTQSGTVAGTPMYMSPEQAEGLPIDHRSDLFSLGTVLYAMCTGHPPFRASGTHAVLKRVIDASPRPIREINNEIPDWLEAIIAKLHAKKPGERFQTAKEVAELLGQHLAHVQQPNLVAAPAPVAVPATEAKTWHVGDRVLAPWAREHQEYLYVCTVLEVKDDSLRVAIEGGVSVWVKASEVRPDDIRSGTRVIVFGWWIQSFNVTDWWIKSLDATVTERVGHRIHVRFDDGKSKWHKVSKILVPTGEPAKAREESHYIMPSAADRELAALTPSLWPCIGRSVARGLIVGVILGLGLGLLYPTLLPWVGAGAESGLALVRFCALGAAMGMFLGILVGIVWWGLLLRREAPGAAPVAERRPGDPTPVPPRVWWGAGIGAFGFELFLFGMALREDTWDLRAALLMGHALLAFMTLAACGLFFALRRPVRLAQAAILCGTLSAACAVAFVVTGFLLHPLYSVTFEMDDPAILVEIWPTAQTEPPVNLAGEFDIMGPPKYVIQHRTTDELRLPTGNYWLTAKLDGQEVHRLFMKIQADPLVWYHRSFVTYHREEKGKVVSWVSETTFGIPKVVSVPGLANLVKIEKNKLQGTWRAVSGERDGKAHPEELIPYFLRFAGDRVTVQVGTKQTAKEGAYELNPRKRPATLDLTDAFKETMFAIYRWEGDALHVCASEKERPTEFTAKPGSKRMLLLLHRDAAPSPQKSDEPGWVQLFNGKDLAGWVMHGDKSVWIAQDGMIVGKGARLGYLATERTDFENFHLRVEARIHKGGKSGISFRGQPQDNLPRPGYEAEISAGAQYQNTGSLWCRRKPPEAANVIYQEGKELAPPDSWFTLEIIAEGNRIVTRVNGQQAANVIDNTFRRGPIELQIWGDSCLVQFKKIEIKELPPAEPSWVQLFNGKDLTGWEVGGTWIVQDGFMHGVGKDSSVTTKKKFSRDFHLRAELKPPTSGLAKISFRAAAGDESGFEVLLDAADPGLTGILFSNDGQRLGPVVNAGKAPETPPNTPMRIEVIARADEIEVRVNGQLRSAAKINRAAVLGMAIILKDRGNSLDFSKVEIKELPPEESGWVQLFNGKDLDGWVPYLDPKLDPKKNIWGPPGSPDGEVAFVTQETEHKTGAYLRTERTYRNYVLELEYRSAHVMDDHVRAALILHAVPPFNAEPKGFALKIIKGGSSIYNVAGAKFKEAFENKFIGTRPEQEWNKLTVISRDGTLEWIINGERVGAVKVLEPAEGCIALDGSHAGPNQSMQIRQVRIRELDSPMEPAFQPIFNGKDLEGWVNEKNLWKWEAGTLVGRMRAGQHSRSLLYGGTRNWKDFELKFDVRVKNIAYAGVIFRGGAVEFLDEIRLAGPIATIGESTATGPPPSIHPMWGGLLDSGGKGWLKAPPLNAVKKILKEGDFNTYLIRVVGSRVTIQVNGINTVDEDLPKLDRDGQLVWLLQENGKEGEVTFRKIEIKELPPTPNAKVGDLSDDLKAIIKGLSDKDAGVRGDTARSLEKLGDKAAVPALLKRLEDDEFGWTKWFSKRRNNVASCKDHAFDALVKLAPEKAAEGLRGALRSKNVKGRAWACETLAAVKGNEAEAALLIGLMDKEASVRTAAAKAVGKRGEAAEATRARLRALTEDPDATVRAAASEALAKVQAKPKDKESK